MNTKELQVKIFWNVFFPYMIISNLLGFIAILYTIKMTQEVFYYLLNLFIIIGTINLITNLAISFYFLRPISKIANEIENGKTYGEEFILKTYDKILSYPYILAICGTLTIIISYTTGTVLLLIHANLSNEQIIKGLLIGVSMAIFYGLTVYILVNNTILKLSPKFTKFITFSSRKKLSIFSKIVLSLLLLLLTIAILSIVIIYASMENLAEKGLTDFSEKNLQHLIHYDLRDIKTEAFKQNYDIFKDYFIDSDGYIYVINTSGNVLLPPPEKADKLDYDLIQQILKNNNIEHFDPFKNHVIVSRYSEIHNAIFISVANIRESLSNIMQTLKFFSFMFFSIYLTSLLAVIYLASNITEPIKEFYDLAKSLSGNNSEVKYVLTRTGDELGDLAALFNKMAFELNEHRNLLEKKVVEKTEELNSKIKESEETKKAIVNMMDDIDNTNKTLIEAQVKLKENLEELKILDKKKNEFVSIIAHELKTPITSIKGFVELLENKFENLDAEARKKYFEIIHTDTERLNKLISDIMDLTKLDLKTLKLDIGEVSIAELFKDLDDELGIIVRKKNLEFIQEIDENAPKSVVSDKGRLLQILSNLTNNAMHYTEKGSIKIRAALKGDTVLFSVADTGMGIPSEHMGKLFQRFYQVDSSYTRKIGGSGLGLAVCKGLVESLGGKIWLESTMDVGTTFYFTIPVK